LLQVTQQCAGANLPEESGEKKNSKRFSFMRKSKKLDDGNAAVLPKESNKGEYDTQKVLEKLDLAAIKNRAFSLAKELQVLVQKVTLILKIWPMACRPSMTSSSLLMTPLALFRKNISI
jgi:hypothetical protein